MRGAGQGPYTAWAVGGRGAGQELGYCGLRGDCYAAVPTNQPTNQPTVDGGGTVLLQLLLCLCQSSNQPEKRNEGTN